MENIKDKVAQPTNGALASIEAAPVSPRQLIRLVEDEIDAIERRYNVRIVGVIKTTNGGQQMVDWEVALVTGPAS